MTDAREEMDRMYLQAIAMGDAAQAFDMKLRSDINLPRDQRTKLLREVQTLRGDLARMRQTIHDALDGR